MRFKMLASVALLSLSAAWLCAAAHSSGTADAFVERYHVECDALRSQSPAEQLRVYQSMLRDGRPILNDVIGTAQERKLREIVLALANGCGDHAEAQVQLRALASNATQWRDVLSFNTQLAVVLSRPGVQADEQHLLQALAATDVAEQVIETRLEGDWLAEFNGSPLPVLAVFQRRGEILSRLGRYSDSARALERGAELSAALPQDVRQRQTLFRTEGFVQQAASAHLRAGAPDFAIQQLLTLRHLEGEHRPVNFHALVISNIPMSGAYRGFAWRWLNEQSWDQYTPHLVLVYAIIPAIDGHDDTANPVEWRRRSIELLSRLLTENDALITAADASDDVNGMARAARAQGREPTALEREPGRAQVHATLMDLFWADGRIPEALQHARILVDRYPMHATAASASKLIKDYPQTQ